MRTTLKRISRISISLILIMSMFIGIIQPVEVEATASVLPVVGEPLDAINAALYLAQGDNLNAGLSAASMIPVVGSLGVIAKGGNKVGKALEKATKSTNGIRTVTKGTGIDIVGTGYNKIRPTQDVINSQKVAEYADKLQAGKKLDPVEVVKINGKGSYIIEGHHRFVASQKTGIPVKIKVTHGQGPIGLPDWSDVQWRKYISESQFWGD